TVATASLKSRAVAPPRPGGCECVWERGSGGEGLALAATTGVLASATLFGTVQGTAGATLTGHVVRDLVESLTSPSLFYGFTVKLADIWLPESALAGPLEIDESIDTPARLFTFTLTGRQYSIHNTETTWTSAPVEVWVTAGPIEALRTWRRAFGHVLTCEQIEGPEPTLKIRCADPSRLYDRYELCYEFPADAGLTRGEICRQILTDAGFTPDVPA